MDGIDKKNKRQIGVIIVATFLVVFLGASFAYLASRRFMKQSIELGGVSTATAKDLKLTYTDCVESNPEDCNEISKDLEPGDSVTKTFMIANTSGYDLKYTLYFSSLLNSFKNDELVYKIEDIDKGETFIDTTPLPYEEELTVDVPIKEEILIKKNDTHRYRLTITFLNTDYDQSDNLDAEYYVSIGFAQSIKKPISVIGKYSRGTTDDFNTVSTTYEGIYEMEDNYGISYYYRGLVDDNYVYFANKYWRLVRINGDGSWRVIYDGTSNNGDDLEKTIGKTTYDESKIRGILDDWYALNIEETGYGNYVANGDFCRSTSVDEDNVIPQFTCSIDTTSQDKPIGMLTVDEVIASGSGIGIPFENYLSNEYPVWTASLKEDKVYAIKDRKVSLISESQEAYVIPVINLNSEFVANLKGNGSSENPYRK